jgi:hypothetical protein
VVVAAAIVAVAVAVVNENGNENGCRVVPARDYDRDHVEVAETAAHIVVDAEVCRARK